MIGWRRNEKKVGEGGRMGAEAPDRHDLEGKLPHVISDVVCDVRWSARIDSCRA